MTDLTIGGYSFYREGNRYLTNPKNKDYYEGAKEYVITSFDSLGINATVMQSNQAKHGSYMSKLIIMFNIELW